MMVTEALREDSHPIEVATETTDLRPDEFVKWGTKGVESAESTTDLVAERVVPKNATGIVVGYTGKTSSDGKPTILVRILPMEWLIERTIERGRELHEI